MKAHAFFI